MRAYQQRIIIWLVFSVAFHLLIILLLIFLPYDEEVEAEKIFQVTLRDTPKAPPVVITEGADLVKEKVKEPPQVMPEPDELIDASEEEVSNNSEPSPIDNSDEMSTNNQDSNLKGKVVGGGNKSEKESIEPVKQLSIEQKVDAPAKLIDQVEFTEVKEPENLKRSPQEKKEIRTPKIIKSKNNEAAKSYEEFMPSYLDPIENILEADQKQGQVTPNSIEVLAGLIQETGESVSEITTDTGIDLDALGNIQLLPDTQLSEVSVPQPFSEKKSNELRLVNKYLKRMNEQVMAYWVNPYRGNQVLLGMIKIELNKDGYLVNSYVYRESGDKILDISVLDAIRAVRKFEVPANNYVAERYYRNLKFHYSSIKQEVELMPFETESSK